MNALERHLRVGRKCVFVTALALIAPRAGLFGQQYAAAAGAAGADRDTWAGIADAFGFLVVVPEFDPERFPNRLYQTDGVFRENGSVAFLDAERRPVPLDVLGRHWQPRPNAPRGGPAGRLLQHRPPSPHAQPYGHRRPETTTLHRIVRRAGVRVEPTDSDGLERLNRVARVMREAEIQGVSPRKGKRTTVRAKKARPAPDLVARDFTATPPDEMWVAEITYVPTWAGFLYVAMVLDVWSRRIVGWAMATYASTLLGTATQCAAVVFPPHSLAWPPACS